MDVPFLMSILRLYPGLQISAEHNSVCKNFLLSAYFCWDCRHFLNEMDQKLKFGGTIGYGDSYSEFLIRQFKVFRLHSTLHDASRAVRTHSGKRSEHFHMTGRRRNSCLFPHVTGLHFCLYVKLFLPSVFNSVDFRSSMFCFVLDFELPNINLFKELGVFIDGNVQGESFCPLKGTNSSDKPFGVQTTCTELCGTVNDCITVGFPTFFPEKYRVNTLQQEQ